MTSKAYNEWIKLYDNDFENVWYSQPVKLRKAAMLLKAVENEFKKIYKHMETECMRSEQKIEKIEMHKSSDSISKNDENNECDLIMPSPDVIICSGMPKLPILNDSTNVIGYSSSEDENKSKSPKINRLRKMKFTKAKSGNIQNYSSLKLLEVTPKKIKNVHDVIDSTMVETLSVIPNIQKNKHNRYGERLVKNGKKKNSTITQMFSNITDNMDNGETSNASIILDRNQVEIIPPNSPMNIDHNNDSQRSTKEVKLRPIIYKQPTVRGKERLKLEGWDCAECRRHYNEMNLDPETKKKLLNKCSRHRSKFKPNDYTPKSYWKMGFPPTPVKDSSDSICLQY